MGKVEDALRELILYHGKKAAAEALAEVPGQIRQVRRELRALQKTVTDLAAEVKALATARERSKVVPPAPDDATERIKFSQDTPKKLREQFDLTQQELAQLLEVSTMTITSWETGKSRPRRANLAQIVTLKDMGQAQVDSALGRTEAPAEITADEFRKIRERLALTQADLAQLVNVSIASVASWEAGKTIPSRASRAAVAELTGATPADVERKLGHSMAGRMRVARQAKSSLTPEAIRAIREKHGMSQRELARALDVSINTISNWETSRSTPRGRSVEKLLEMQG